MKGGGESYPSNISDKLDKRVHELSHNNYAAVVETHSIKPPLLKKWMLEGTNLDPRAGQCSLHTDHLA